MGSKVGNVFFFLSDEALLLEPNLLHTAAVPCSQKLLQKELQICWLQLRPPRGHGKPPKPRPDPESLEVGIAAGLLIKFPGRFLMQPRLEEVAPQATWKRVWYEHKVKI